MKTLITNDDLQIIYTEEQDLHFVLQAEQAADNSEWVSRWLAKEHTDALSCADTLHLIIRHDGQSIGYIIVKGLLNPHNSIELLRIVITTKGLGHGKMAINLLKKWCFEQQKAHRLWLDVKEHNLRAQHVYKTLGFKREGVLRECIRTEAGYRSLVVMSILSQEYFAE